MSMQMQSVDAKTGAYASLGRNPVNIQVVLPSLILKSEKNGFNSSIGVH